MSVFSPGELVLFEREVARFIREDYSVDRRQKLLESGGFGSREWQVYGELGWLGLAIPEAFGGMGGGLQDLLTILQASGRGLLMEPLTSTLVIGATLIEQLGNEQQKSALLPLIADGSLTLGFAHSPNGAGATDTSLRSIRDPLTGAFRLHGHRRAVLQAMDVDRVLVTARDGMDASGGPVRLFLIDPKARGVAMKPYRMIDDRSAADMEYRDVVVTGMDCLSGPELETALERTLATAAIASAAESVGAMEALNEMTLSHAKTRRQFGRTLGSFQVLQHRLVDMMMAARQARALVKQAAVACDDNAPEWCRLASSCKAMSARAGRFVGEQAIQIHGGLGMSEEYPAGHYLKRLLLLGAQFGDADFHLQRLATAEPDQR